jgi:hypothetical protein
VTRGGDDANNASPRSDESSSSTSVSVSSSPVTTPPTSSVTAAPAGTDKEKAVASMAAAFATQPGVTPDQAQCVARTTIEAVGLKRLVEIGMFDASMAFHDLDLGEYPDVLEALTEATVTCVAA